MTSLKVTSLKMTSLKATSWNETDVAALAEALFAARATRQVLATRDLPPPPDVAAAFAVQAQVMALRGGTVQAWKVGVRPGLGAVAAPMAPFSHAEQGNVTLSWHDRIGIEVEVAFRLAEDIRVGAERPWTDDDLLARIDGVFLGIEVTGGRLADGNAAPAPLFVADCIDNDGYVLGPRLSPDIVGRVDSRSVPLVLRGPVQWDGVARHPTDDTLAPLLGFANARVSHLGGLRAGQIISTGALCGLLPVPLRGTVDVVFDGISMMRLEFI